jgi:starch phosphorylase
MLGRIADIWLNTPLRPMESCGASGMKAVANGLLNVSTVNCWWDEDWAPEPPGVRLAPGLPIGDREDFEGREYQDQIEAPAPYDILEQDLVPGFYDRKAHGLPRRWLARMQAAIAGLCPVYNSHRMVREDVENYCLAAHQRHTQLTEIGAANEEEFPAWKARVGNCWPQIKVESVEAARDSEVSVGSAIQCRAQICLGESESILIPGRIALAGDVSK